MKKVILSIIGSILMIHLCNSQTLVNAFDKDQKILVQFDNGTTIEIVSSGQNTLIAFSRAKNIVIYQRIEQKSKTQDSEGEENYDQLSIRLFDLTSNKERTLFTTCLDGLGGTIPEYANSSIYPNNYLCGFESPILTKDGERLFFQTYGWHVSPAIHYFHIKSQKLIFYKAGWLQNITAEGVEVQITGADENTGRYTQNCLFDMNGDIIKELSGKEF